MLDQTEFERWRAAADDAQRAAETAANAGHHSWACFLAEQAAQLALKGLLHGVGSGAWGHDLVDLGQVLSETLESELPESLTPALQRLSRHYIPTRYPDAHASGSPESHYGRSDVEQALEDLAIIQKYVEVAWAAFLEQSELVERSERGEDDDNAN